MKKILFLTDFSSTARNAIYFGINLFSHEEYDYMMLNCFERIFTPGGVVDTLNESQYQESQTALLKEETIINLHLGASISFEKISFLGNIANGVNEVEDNHDLLMVIMGTKGAKNLPEILFGSNASSLSKYIDVPLLVVPK